VSCDKNHITGVTTKGTVTVTVHGFIDDDPKAIEKYKKEHKHEWLNILGNGDFSVVEDKTDWEESVNNIPLIGDDE
jgi:hypothetical protein